MPKITITHFSDILCVWAYISEIRIDQLEAEFGNQIELEFRLLPVFGNVEGKMAVQWHNKGGITAYQEHVLEVAGHFNHLSINPRVWLDNTPSSSLPGHLYLSAIRLVEKEGLATKGAFAKFKKTLRHAFFSELQDISKTSVIEILMRQSKLPVTDIQKKINEGEAYAQLMEDMQLAQELSVKSSPTLIFNEDRQRLSGNVGYRIIEANVRELLDHPENEQSWC